MEFVSEEERYETGVIPHDLVLPLAETAITQTVELTLTETE